MGFVSPASAQEPASPPTLAPDAQVNIATTPPEGKTGEEDSTLPTAPPEAPPPRPHKKGVVLEQTAGVLGFGGQFRHVAPPGFWLHMQLGYEVFSWLMVFASGELAFSSTDVSQDPSHSMAFPMYGFGGGLRGTFHVTDRVAFFVQGEAGALTAYVPHDSLEILGYREAESLNAQFGGRLGLEWYQIDRHLALTAQGGVRDATGFAKVVGESDIGLLWDAALGLRYTF
ncbi:MAG: hypothetical protein ABSE49_29605 [Polyangiaceae bacterium]|jgi:hypothetical protein